DIGPRLQPRMSGNELRLARPSALPRLQARRWNRRRMPDDRDRCTSDQVPFRRWLRTVHIDSHLIAKHHDRPTATKTIGPVGPKDSNRSRDIAVASEPRPKSLTEIPR